MVVSGGGAFVGAIGFRGLCAKRAGRSPTRARGAAHSPIVPLLICPRPLWPPSVLPADDDATAGPSHRRHRARRTAATGPVAPPPPGPPHRRHRARRTAATGPAERPGATRRAIRRDPSNGRTGLPGPPQEGAEHLARAVGAAVSSPLRGAGVVPGHRPCE